MGEVIESKGVEQGVFLPPCKVCGDQAAGFHYGVNTCEACKGFFHRSLRRYKEYKCRANRTSGYCEYKPGKRKSCQYCRYQKCLDAGMSKGAIKTGRYTYIKKTEDTKEIQRLQKNRLTASPVDPAPSSAVNSPSDRDTPGSVSSNADVEKTTFQRVNGQTEAANSSSEESVTDRRRSPAVNHARSTGTHEPLRESDQSLERDRAKMVGKESISENSPKCAAITSVSSAIQRYKAELINRLVKSCAAHLLSQRQANDPSAHSTGHSQSPVADNPCCAHKQRNINQLNAGNLDALKQSVEVQAPSDVCAASELPCGQSRNPAHSSGLFQKLISGCQTRLGQKPVLTLPGACNTSVDVSDEGATTREDQSITLHIMGEYMSTQVGVLTSPTRQQKLSPVQSLLTASSPTSPNFQTSPLSSPSNSDDIFYQAFDHPAEMTASSVPSLFRDRDHVTDLLVESHREHVRAFQDFNLIPREEIRSQQLAHYEACRLKNKTFGRLDFLPEKEYDDIYSVTGMDIDNRRRVISLYLTKMEKCVRCIVQFAKSIPGFSSLDISTQVELIKSSRSEFAMLTTYPTVNLELGVTIGLCGFWTCTYESDKIGTDVGIQEYMKFADGLQKLDLTYEEVVLLKAITVMTTDRDATIVSPLAEAIHWELCLCLLHSLQKRHQKPMIHLARHISALTQIRTVSDQFQEFLKTLKLDKYSSIEQNPLLLELFSSVIQETGDKQTDCKKFDFSEDKNINLLPAFLCTCKQPPQAVD